METTLSLLDRSLTLQRFPIRKNETLQAWDSADEYLIHHFEQQQDLSPQHYLILNDTFGALSCWFQERSNVTLVTDSFIAKQATEQNLSSNNANPILIQDGLKALPEADAVMMKLPKSKRLLTWQLIQLCQALPDGTIVVTAGKAKDIHTSTLKLFERYLGKTTTSLAKKKSRLIFTTVDKSTSQPLPKPLSWSVDEYHITLTNHANVYSGESLDLGARFILPHLPKGDKYKHIIDLGCGNGVLTIRLAQLNPSAKITSIDESYMAITSATENCQLNVPDNHNIDLKVNNCLDDFDLNSADMVICNPPFHQQNTITDHIAWQMFNDAYQVLEPNGKLMVIGNSHLKYHEKLNRLFGNCSKVASNKKFVIYQSEKQ
ncbi:methyltransferase [Vibrio sp. SS-MA-C1-2]|uniref:methyltransferase n=1 Tax=Vibrio sp. SS-MA-C1-2 TaxID=2908646 RepID=UPI001F3FB2AD|nr:methyltransferase [Vibrio sp. SS-MA-C1-2]UJF18842.1 methyltransferase [Vibrio sp. SS-MA-C1-2]